MLGFALRDKYVIVSTKILVVLGTIDDALARQVVRTGTLGFRLGVLTLGALGVASFAVVLGL